MIDDDGVVAAYVLDGKGGGKELQGSTAADLNPTDGFVWLHLDRNVSKACRQAVEAIGLDNVFADALLAEETHPRVVASANGLLIILRGVNTNPGSQPEDMVSLRMWIEQNRVISVRIRPLGSVRDIRDRIEVGQGPKSTGDFLVMITDRLVERMGPVINGLSERLDHLEDSIDTLSPRDARGELRDIRHQAIMLRRHLAPQRDVMGRLQMENQPWLLPEQKIELREVASATARYVEELDAVRERAGVVHDEMVTLASEAMNRTMYMLTLVATIILPLSFVTGLLGMNVGGIPLAETKPGFWLVTGTLFAIGILIVVLFRWLKWLR
ncbi:MAG: zinc transporter ZntB [Alphaproteobacteria bacterium]|nr:zinc transporter ZntB [Alphaproteobacteria bacterium]